MDCPTCGVEARAGTTECDNCGGAFDEPAPAPAPPSPARAPAPAPRAAPTVGTAPRGAPPPPRAAPAPPVLADAADPRDEAPSAVEGIDVSSLRATLAPGGPPAAASGSVPRPHAVAGGSVAAAAPAVAAPAVAAPAVAAPAVAAPAPAALSAPAPSAGAPGDGAGCPVVLEIETGARYRPGELCQLTFRLTNVTPRHLFVTLSVGSDHLPLRETEKTLELDAGARQRVVSFAFLPERPGRATLRALALEEHDRARGAVAVWALPDESVVVPVEANRHAQADGVVVSGGIHLTLGEVYGADVANLVNLSALGRRDEPGEAARTFAPLLLRFDATLTCLAEERVALAQARTTPRDVGRLVAAPGARRLERAVVLVGAAGQRRLFLFARERLRVGRKKPPPGDPEANDVVLRVPLPPRVAAGTPDDPNLRIGREHLEVVRDAAQAVLGQRQTDCPTEVDGQRLERGGRRPLPERFRAVLGTGAVALQGRVVRAAPPVSAVRLDPGAPGVGLLPPPGSGGAEAPHPLLAVSLAREALPAHEYHLVLRQVSIGSAPGCGIELPAAGVAPVHARVLNLRGTLVLQPVVARGLTALVAGQPVLDPALWCLLSPGLEVRLGEAVLRVCELDPGAFEA